MGHGANSERLYRRAHRGGSDVGAVPGGAGARGGGGTRGSGAAVAGGSGNISTLRSNITLPE